jgi:preprotein translocase subunit SecD
MKGGQFILRKGTSAFALAGIVVLVCVAAALLWQPIKGNINLGLDLQGGLHVVLKADETQGDEITADTISKSINILRTRVDELGVAEPILYPQGKDRIVVELAGVSNPEEAINIIKTTSRLEFYDEAGTMLLTGDHLRDAQAEIRSTTQAVVNFEFDSVGTDLFAKATQDNLGKRIVIMLDDNVVSAPTVNSVISGGRGYIEGMGPEEAANLAITLRSGALPVSFEIMEKRTVGPTLGADSLSKSVVAGGIGLISVLIFMIGYYRLPGVVAAVSLILYSVLVLGIMVMMGSVLTLPGIAGFALSVAMAVDANVIIYERIKEDLRAGKSLRASIESGFKHATGTILDANLTTLIVAAVLMYFGTGPVRGFAVILTIGIIMSIVVALLFVRLVMTLLSRVFGNAKLYGI